MVERSFAALVAVVCLVLLARLFMPERYRWRLDAWAWGVWRALSAAALRVWHWRSSRKSAAHLADEAIRRARHGVERDGNVLRPRSFGASRKSRGPGEARDTGEPRKPH